MKTELTTFCPDDKDLPVILRSVVGDFDIDLDTVKGEE